jgi:3-phosphoshikimate 1-carboxyvinyltransferase
MAHLVTPAPGPLDASVRPPGSKSLTNRALVCAALAPGRSVIRGALAADDTEAMIEGLRALGVAIEVDGVEGDELRVDGGSLRAGDVDARQSGTTARFLLPVLALVPGTSRLDGSPQLRSRPMADGIDALRRLGAEVVEEGEPGHLPVRVTSGAGRGGTVQVRGDASSQFLSGLLLAGFDVAADGPLVSKPYVDMTRAVVAAFAAGPTSYDVEPDASAASYFFAAAAICGGRVTVEGLGTGSLQGDLRFVDVLERMGCTVDRRADATTVERPGDLTGVDVDLADLSDTAQTLAAVAVFAEGPTRVRGIGFIRRKETDRVGNVVRELRRCGIEAEEEPDGFVVHPGKPQPATVETYEDHRMAMSFALLGLRAEGIRIADPGCVAKTFPTYWEALARLVSATPEPH